MEAELNAIPSYLKEFVSEGGPLTVEIGDGTEVWKNASGKTLFNKEKTDHSEIWSLTLPADENRYTPTLEFSSREADGRISFNLDGSMIRGKMVLPEGISEEDFSPVTGDDEEDYDEVDFPLTGSEDEAEGETDSESEGEPESEYADEPDSESGNENEGSYEDEESSTWPKTMFILSVSGDSIPTALPCDSSFSLAASMQGALYPNFDVVVRGKT